jgi:hypothetical protein
MKLDKHKQHNSKNIVRQIFLAIKRQKAKLSPKKSQWSRHSVTPGHHGDRLKINLSTGKRIDI